MNDGVKILLDRMVTHPEEFVDETNLGSTKWSGLLNYYDNVLTLEEKKAIESGLLKIKRDAFTKQVMERLLDEPVQLDPNTYTINTVGRDPWGSSTLQLHQKAHSDYLDAYKQELSKQIREEQLKLAAEAYKKELKNKSPFEKIKGKKYP
jgi:hypothetical protein